MSTAALKRELALLRSSLAALKPCPSATLDDPVSWAERIAELTLESHDPGVSRPRGLVTTGKLTRRRAEVRSLSISEDLTGQSGLGTHGPLKSARLRRKSEATSSTLRPCKSTAALRAAIVSLLSWPDSFSKGALICGNRSKVVLRTTGASM